MVRRNYEAEAIEIEDVEHRDDLAADKREGGGQPLIKQGAVSAEIKSV